MRIDLDLEHPGVLLDCHHHAVHPVLLAYHPCVANIETVRNALRSAVCILMHQLHFGVVLRRIVPNASATVGCDTGDAVQADLHTSWLEEVPGHEPRHAPVLDSRVTQGLSINFVSGKHWADACVLAIEMNVPFM